MFYLEIILYFLKSCKDNTESLHMPFICLPLVLYNCGNFINTMKLTLAQNY